MSEVIKRDSTDEPLGVFITASVSIALDELNIQVSEGPIIRDSEAVSVLGCQRFARYFGEVLSSQHNFPYTEYSVIGSADKKDAYLAAIVKTFSEDVSRYLDSANALERAMNKAKSAFLPLD